MPRMARSQSLPLAQHARARVDDGRLVRSGRRGGGGMTTTTTR